MLPALGLQVYLEPQLPAVYDLYLLIKGWFLLSCGSLRLQVGFTELSFSFLGGLLQLHFLSSSQLPKANLREDTRWRE